MERRVPRTLFLMLICGLAVSGEARAWDWLTLYPLEAEAILRFDGTERSSDQGFTTTKGSDRDWRYGFRLQQEGYTADPAIARYLVQVEPTWSTGTIDTDGVIDDRSGRFLNYLVHAEGLQGTPGPVGFYLSLMQNQNLNTGSLGSRSETDIKNNTLGFNWKNLAFPMRFVFDSRTLTQDFRTGTSGATSRRDEKRDVFRIDGRSSKTDLSIEHESLDDRVPERDHDYTTDRLTLNHRLEWGHQSRLRSRIYYYDRQGFNANTRFTWSEAARLQHASNLYSRARYTFNTFEQSQTTTENTGEYGLYHRLYNNLNSSARLLGRTVRSDSQDVDEWRTGVRTDYNKSNLLFGGAVRAGLGYDFQLTDRQSKLGLLEIVDEAHVVPLAGDVILDRRFILASTVIVTDEDRQLVYEQGLDYELFELTGDLTQVQAIPGGRMETGSTILVSYQAYASPTQEYSTTFTNVNLGYSRSWMRFLYYDNRQDQKLQSGIGESLLTDRQDTSALLEFFWRMWDIDARVSAEHRYNMVGDFESTTNLLRESFTWAATGRSVWKLNLVQQQTESTDRDTDLYNAELTITWRPASGLTIRPTFGVWSRTDTGPSVGGVRDDTYVVAGVNLRWYYRKVAFDLDLHSSRRTVNDLDTNETRLRFNLIRRF